MLGLYKENAECYIRMYKMQVVCIWRANEQKLTVD